MAVPTAMEAGLKRCDAGRDRLTWFVLSPGAATTQTAQFAIVEGRLTGLPPLVIVARNQAVALVAWVTFFLITGQPFTPPRAVWPAVLASGALVTGMSSPLARASARGDICPSTAPPPCSRRG